MEGDRSAEWRSPGSASRSCCGVHSAVGCSLPTPPRSLTAARHECDLAVKPEQFDPWANRSYPVSKRRCLLRRFLCEDLQQSLSRGGSLHYTLLNNLRGSYFP